MAEEIQQTLATLNRQLQEQGVTTYKIGVASPFDLKLLDRNARFMTKEVFDVLTAGVKAQGLSSLPFCYFDGTYYHVLSGNHRVKAAREANVKSMLFLYTDEHMTKEEQIQVQLAHNQITGQDDPQVLLELWQDIKDVELKFLTGFDDDFFDKLEPVEFAPIKEPAIRFKSVLVMFLQEDLDKFQEAADLIKEEAGSNPVFLARYADFESFFQAVLRTKSELKIVNTATAIRRMSEITIAYLDEQKEGQES
jgi:hypothetical protein